MNEPVVDSRRLTFWKVYWTGLPIILRQTFLLVFAVGSWRNRMEGANKGKLGVFFALFHIPIVLLTVFASALWNWLISLVSVVVYLAVLLTSPIWFLGWAWYQKKRVEPAATRKLVEKLSHGA